MLWCQGVHNIGLPNHKLESVLTRAPYDHNARPSHADRQTDEHHGNRDDCSKERIAR